MATDSPQPPEGSTPVGQFKGEEESIELEPGEVLEGRVVEIRSGKSSHGPWWMYRMFAEGHEGIIRYFAKGEAKTAAANDEVSGGDEVWIAVDTEEETATIDGEEKSWYPTIMRKLNGDS